MSSMHRKALVPGLLLASAAVGAQLAPTGINQAPPAQAPASETPRYQAPPPQQQAYAPAPVVPSGIAATIARWSSLRQTDNLPFSSYASFLLSHPGWPGESALRRTAERAIDPDRTSASEVVSFFRSLPPLTATGHARHAFALLATGDVEGARAAARRAWVAGVLPKTDEDRMLGLFGAALTPELHDERMEVLLGNRDTQSAARTLPFASAAKRPVYEARLALQTKAADASAKLALAGPAAENDPGLLVDRVKWLRDGAQAQAARALFAQPRSFAAPPRNAEKYMETLLVLAQGAASDRNWQTAYQIASQLDGAFPPGTNVITRSVGERDEYTSLAWLAGTTALHQLGRPADASAMFVRYARGGQSAQVLTKGYYWAGRAAQQAGQAEQARAYFSEAARHPELFYGQLAMERLGLTVPPPAASPSVQPTEAQRAAFRQRSVVEATRALGTMGRQEDQAIFVRHLAETAANEIERALAAELGRQIGRNDLGVWVSRSARNAGSPFYVRTGWPEVQIPPAQGHLWSLAHGIIRQESSFDRTAVSHAGARGMMQLMTPTAREVSGKIGVGYDFGRLTGDPQYNIRLGSAYFQQLMDYWGGYAPLAVASYNAGMGNVRRWVRENGDPRMPHVDVIRWIEEIPFSETRGYVQRVLENAVVYEAMEPGRARSPERTRLSYHLGKTNQPG